MAHVQILSGGTSDPVGVLRIKHMWYQDGSIFLISVDYELLAGSSVLFLLIFLILGFRHPIMYFTNIDITMSLKDVN